MNQREQTGPAGIDARASEAVEPAREVSQKRYVGRCHVGEQTTH
jgi:2-furoyl-CoA dehydrogenase large subunit